MKCKKCKADIPDDLHPVYCCYCGEKLQRERKKKDEIKIPTPRKRGQKWYVDLRREGVTVIEETEAEAKAKALAIRAGFVPAKKKPGDMTLSEAITKYIESRTNRLDETSKQQYEYIRDNRFKELMPLKLSEITDQKIDEAFDAELGKPSRKGGTLSKKTVNDALNLVKAVLRKYYGELEVTVEPAEIQRSFRFLLSIDQICSAVIGTDIELPVLLAMWLSLTASEIRGLTKSKSIHDGQLYIVETVVNVRGGAYRKAGAKEEERPRAFKIPPYIADLIDKVDGDIIETRSAHALNQRFQRVLRNNGLPVMRFHDLRHPYVKHTTKIFSLRLMDFQAQAYPDARRKTRGACQLHRGGQSRSPVRPLCNRKRFSCLPPQSKMSWILYAISMRLSGYTSTRSISSSASSVVSVSASKIALDASLRLSCRACSSCFCFACANTAA